MKRYATYIFLIGFLIVAILMTEGVLTFRQGPLIFLAVLSHAPAFLSVAKQNALFGKPVGVLARYPEAMIPVTVLVSWTTISLLGNKQFAPAASGVIIAIALSACYGAVRVVVAFSTKSARLSTHVPDFTTKALRDISTRGIYLMRVVLAAASLFGLVTFLLTGQAARWLPLISVATICVVALLALFSIRIERTLSRRVAGTASQALAERLFFAPSDVALYYSGPANSLHTAPAKLATRLAKEGILPVIIMREAGARKILSKSPHRHLWMCPTIDTLDAAAQPGLRAVFYVNDALKNGHFVRFNDFSHILLATGGLAANDSLPRSCSMYDVIIAPDKAKADLWRAAANPDLARRIVTVGGGGRIGTKYTAAKRYASPCPVLTIHLSDWGLEPNPSETKLQELLIMLQRLVKAIVSSGLARLEIWFPLPESGAGSAMLRLLHRDAELAISSSLTYDEEGRAEPSLVTLKAGTPADAANAADFPIATSASDLDALHSTGKPLLWFDPMPAPDGVRKIENTASNFASALQAAWQECSRPEDFSVAAPDTIGHYSDLRSLVEKMTIPVDAVRNEAKLSC